MRTLNLISLVALLASCASPMRAPDGSDPGGKTDAPGDLGENNDPSFNPGAADFEGEVYAHDADMMYTVDPDSLAVAPLHAFIWPTDIGWDTMTDIAVDSTGRIFGISFNYLYSIDASTGECTLKGSLDQSFNGLSFVPAYWMDDSTQREVLVGVASDGSLWKVNTSSGKTSSLAQYNQGYVSSGDIVSVDDFGTVVTVRGEFDTEEQGDWLATLDPSNGELTLIGQTNVPNIWGLAFWWDKLYGFTPSGAVVIIDPDTAATTITEQSDIEFWGAGVTTIAPATIE